MTDYQETVEKAQERLDALRVLGNAKRLTVDPLSRALALVVLDLLECASDADTRIRYLNGCIGDLQGRSRG